MSDSEQSPSSPVLKDSTTLDSTGALHEVKPSNKSTLSNAGLPFLPKNPSNKASRSKWIPDPDELVPRARTLVLCFDGTCEQFDDDNSNVVNFLACLKKDDQAQQLVYYQAGIGTYISSKFINPVAIEISKSLDEAFAWNLASHIQQGYEFLMQNYTDGDKIAIFGFSRGAYTARALAGMVQKVGLLPASNIQQIPFAYAMYSREDVGGLRGSEAFKKTFSTDVRIDFVGVWDTVASVGFTNTELPFVSNNTAIRVFRHAIALDERRVKFLPNFHQASSNSDPKEAASTIGIGNTIEQLEDQEAEAITEPQAPELVSSKKDRKGKHRHQTQSQIWQAEINSQEEPTDALEVWFAGCHSDVGGGAVLNNTRNSLSRIPLRWMIRECFRMETGIIFNKDVLRENVGLDPDTLTAEHRPPRIPAPIGAKVLQPESQGFAIIYFLKLIGSLLAIPITFAFSVLTWPFKHTWLLVKFTKPVKWLTRKLGVKKWFKKSDKDCHKCDEQALLLPKEPQVLISNFKSEEDEELNDALQPAYDWLSLSWAWWFVEILPMRFREQKGRRNDYFVRANLGAGRMIYGNARKKGVKIHRSVKTRLEVVGPDGKSVYQPRAWFTQKDPITKKHTVVRITNKDDPDPKTEWEWVD